jgi:uncharacterized delta-60 repeat protein
MSKLRLVVGVRLPRFVWLFAVLLVTVVGLIVGFFNNNHVVTANGSTLSFESSAITIPEGQTRVITVTRTGAATQPLTATVIATPGTANVADFTLLNTVAPTVLHKLDGYTIKLAVQPDGKIIAGGYFTVTNGVTYTNIARFNPDGSLDNTFSNSRVNDIEGEVRDLLLLPDGKMLVVVGRFYSSNPRPSFLRLNPNGTVDNTFTIITETSGFPSINKAIIHPDGKIVVSGNINGKIAARLFPNGTLDNSFNAPVYTSTHFTINALAIQSDGKIIAGGAQYTQYPEVSHNLIRLKTDGSLDYIYPKATDHEVYSILIQSGGKMIVSGSAYYSANAQAIGRYNTDGTVDTTFPKHPFSAAGSLTAQPAGKFIAGVALFPHHIARFHSNGSLDGSFRYADKNVSPYSLNAQPDGKLFAGIDLDRSPFYTTFVMPQVSIVRLDPKPTLSWAAGETGTKTFTVTATLDNLAENDEQFELGLQSTEGGGTSVSPAKMVVNIMGATSIYQLALTSQPYISAYGETVTFTATIKPITATGQVTFRDGNNVLGSADIVSGSATFTISNLSPGSHAISAIYGGSSNYPAATSNTINQQIYPPPNLFIVTEPIDDGTGTIDGTFSQTLKRAEQATGYVRIIFAVGSNHTVTMTGQLQVAVPVGAILDGDMNQIIIDGGSVEGDGLRLSGNNVLRKLWVRNFGGREIVADSEGNKLDAVTVSP